MSFSKGAPLKKTGRCSSGSSVDGTLKYSVAQARRCPAIIGTAPVMSRRRMVVDRPTDDVHSQLIRLAVRRAYTETV